MIPFPNWRCTAGSRYHLYLSMDRTESLQINEIFPEDRQRIEHDLRHTHSLLLRVPLHSIGSTSSNADIAEDYLGALYVGESLNGFADFSTAEYGYNATSHKSYIQFQFTISRIHEFLDLLFELASWFDESDFPLPNPARHKIADEIAGLAESLPFKPVKFVDIADSYQINLLSGIGGTDNFDDQSPEDWDHFFPGQPEAPFGYVLSALTHVLGHQCFCSPDNWVLEASAQLPALLQHVGPTNPAAETLLKAELMTVGDSSFLTNGRAAVRLDGQNFSKAQHMLGGTNRERDTSILGYELAANADVVVAYLKHWKILGFIPDRHRLGQQQVESLLSQAEAYTGLLRSCLGRPAAVRCDWSSLSDDMFEQLCCDVLRRSGHYLPESIRKMGLSRSRDGGRDIMALRRPLLTGQKPLQFIVQCKRLTKTRSLSASALSVSDTIDQFGADGYGVMTSGPIDSTLYDKLDGIHRNRGIESDTWDQMRLENFLAERENIDIRDRYFDRDGKGRAERA
jgi:hypothetical protein